MKRTRGGRGYQGRRRWEVLDGGEMNLGIELLMEGMSGILCVISRNFHVGDHGAKAIEFFQL